jgi:hypothetical protein
VTFPGLVSLPGHFYEPETGAKPRKNLVDMSPTIRRPGQPFAAMSSNACPDPGQDRARAGRSYGFRRSSKGNVSTFSIRNPVAPVLTGGAVAAGRATAVAGFREIAGPDRGGPEAWFWSLRRALFR